MLNPTLAPRAEKVFVTDVPSDYDSSSRATPDDRWWRGRRRTKERGARREVERFLLESLAYSRPADEAMLLHLNRLVLGGLKEHEDSGGAYRQGPAHIKWKGKVVYRPPAARSVPPSMERFFSMIDRPPSVSVEEHVGRLYLTLMKVHPFREGNGRTARAFVTYLLLRKDYRPKGGRSLENYIDDNLEEYYVRLFYSSEDAPAYWTPFFERAVEATMRPTGGGVPRLRPLPIATSNARGKLVSLLRAGAQRLGA